MRRAASSPIPAFLSGVALACGLLIAPAVAQTQAGERRLSGAEITAALSERTFVGEWKGTPFRQYFGKDGTTIYLAEGATPSPGRWRADEAKDQYCSQWGGRGWDCYDILGDGPDRIIWVVPGDGYRSPGRLLDGRQLY